MMINTNVSFALLNGIFGFALASSFYWKMHTASLPMPAANFIWEIAGVGLWLIALGYVSFAKLTEQKYHRCNVIFGICTLAMLGNAAFEGGIWADEAGAKGASDFVVLLSLAIITLLLVIYSGWRTYAKKSEKYQSSAAHSSAS